MAESIEALRVRPGGRYLDATVGHGGHAALIAEAMGSSGFLLGLDRDAAAVEVAAGHLAPMGDRVAVVRSSYSSMLEHAERYERRGEWAGILMDLGVGSHQLDDPDRGFAFTHDGELDMRYDRSSGPTAADLIRDLDERALADLLWRLGDERRSRRIARAIVRRRAEQPITRTADLAELVTRACGGRRGRRAHPATRTFQALRVAVNAELDELRAALPQAVQLLEPGGRLVVLCFQSHEDRVVKRFFRNEANPCVCPPDLGTCACGQKPTLKLERKRAVMPSAGEIERNPRARSARLRVAIRTEIPAAIVRPQ